jgi:hypothetical protein
MPAAMAILDEDLTQVAEGKSFDLHFPMAPEHNFTT